MNLDDYKTPGQLIEDLLLKKEWSKRVLAIIIGIDESTLNKVIAGNRPVSADLALSLSEVFTVSADIFLDLQKKYELAKAEIIRRPDPNRANRIHLFGDLPITAMIKRGWINAENIRDIDNVEAELTKFFGANSVSDIEILPHAAKKTQTVTPVTAAQLAWIYRVKQIASEMIVAKYSDLSIRRAINSLKDMMTAPEQVRNIPRLLSECGIRFLIVEALPSSKIDGVCFWLDDKSPVVAMSLRYDRIDNFWFVLRHELEHVLQGHGKDEIMLDAELEGENAGIEANISEEERIANEAAADFCVPKKKIESFVARKYPFFKERDILGLAKTINVHPGLIAGQLQHKTGRYDMFRQHLVKIRDIITPSAIIDGWGDIYPLGI